MARDDDSGTGMAVLKGVLLALGGLTAVGLMLTVLKPMLIIGAVAGAGFVGYKLVSRSKALSEGKSRKALTAGSDYDRRMRELDKIEKRLDAEIGKR